MMSHNAPKAKWWFLVNDEFLFSTHLHQYGSPEAR